MTQEQAERMLTTLAEIAADLKRLADLGDRIYPA